MKVWEDATLQGGASAVVCRMSFNIEQPSGRYKCRLDAQGFPHVFGEDYGETYAPVAAMHTLLSSKLVTAGWVQLDADPSLYIHHNCDGEVIATALIYVDELQLASKDPELVDSVVTEITGWWPCTVLITFWAFKLNTTRRLALSRCSSAPTLTV